MEQQRAVIVLTTWPADRDATILATTLVEERLAACVSLLPEMASTYRWQGAVERASERQAIIKTAAHRVPALLDRLQQLHPYEVPETLVLEVTGGGASYLAWLAASTAP